MGAAMQSRAPNPPSRVAELITGSSIEVAPFDEFAGSRLRELFPPDMTVFVSHPGSVTHHDIVAACARLRCAGFFPIPHIAARRLAGYTQADDFLRRVVAEAGVTSALLVGGDPDRPVGPFHDSLALLASGVLSARGLEQVVFAGHPEGHPKIARRALETALEAKVALAQQLGLDVLLVTQFAFEPEPIQSWLADLRRRGIGCPVRVGIAGPASVATLVKFAVRCGIGPSLRALARGHAAFARIASEVGPDALIDSLVAGEDAAPIDGLHLFTFGGVRRTAMWMHAAAGRAAG